MDLSKLFGGSALPVGAQIEFPDNLPIELEIDSQIWVQTGYVEDDPLNFDTAFWDYTRATVWSRAFSVSGRTTADMAANGNTIILTASATSAPASGGVMVSTDNGVTFGAVIVPPGYTSSEGANAIRWVQSLGLWVIASTLGKIHTSPDGITWTPRTSPTTNPINRIEFANGLLVLVGAAGTILTSANGTTYTLRTSGVTVSLNSVAFYGGVWLAAGDTTAAGGARSTDNGITWNSTTLTTTGFSNTVNVVSSNVGFVITVFSGSGGVFKSATGATGSWVYVGFRTLGLIKPSFNGEFFIFASGSNLYKSYDLVEMRRFNFTSGALINFNIKDEKFLCTAVDGISDSAFFIGNLTAYAGNPTRDGTNVIGISKVSYVRTR